MMIKVIQGHLAHEKTPCYFAPHKALMIIACGKLTFEEGLNSFV